VTIQELEGLLINCTGLSDDEVEALGRRCWSDGYTDDGRVYVAHAHDGEDVYFFPDRFEHAFFTSSNPARHPDAKDMLDRVRIERMRWIGIVIAGQVCGSFCIDAPPAGSQRIRKRIYMVPEERYIVWLNQRKLGGYIFSTAYVATDRHFHTVQRGGKIVWRNKKPRD
jgi:hypothetical protein